MSSSLFEIIEHTVPCQHIREYPRATAYEQEDALRLAVKQYIPLANSQPKHGDVTIIASTACGIPKELYEPLWDELLTRSDGGRYKIRAIWVADAAQQGQSGIINEDFLGNDPCWNDHARDLLHLVNMKKSEMPHPIVGVGHSMGGTQLVTLAHIHPRLFTTLVLIDPAMNNLSSIPPEAWPGTGLLSAHRRDIWRSRDEAAASFRKSPFYQNWDPRVLELWIKYGLRDLPTAIYPSGEAIPSGTEKVTLTTTKHQEVFTFLRLTANDDVSKNSSTQLSTYTDPKPTTYSFSRPESEQAFSYLPELSPSVLYIFGGKSPMSYPEGRQTKLDTTGVGNGGSGGLKAGRVKGFIIEDAGHLMPMEAVTQTADAASEWLKSEMQRWREEEDEFCKMWSTKVARQRSMMDDRWKEMTSPLREKKPVVFKI